MPSPVPDRPGLLIRDPFRYSESVVIIPPPLVPWLTYFDGQRSPLDLREALVRASGGDLRAGEVVENLVTTLSGEGFLDDARFAGMKSEKEAAFREAPGRAPLHAGSAYPVDAEALTGTLARYLADDAGSGEGIRPQAKVDVPGAVIGVAAPHVSPEGGWRAYQAAYAALGPDRRDCTFVILGTSHYGAPEKFGLTRKAFATPLGHSTVDLEAVDGLADAAPDAVEMEDYCHSVEHSIEFQVVFLQHLYGAGVRLVPILCGPFARSTLGAGLPEDDPGVERFLAALAELHSRLGERLVYVLGVDMAHVGRRYGDAFSAWARHGRMAEVERRDRGRIERLCQGDADGFWSDVQEDGDTLRWCGASPLYTLLRSVPCRGELRRYEQWNIDDRSVVSFAGIAFRKASAAEGSVS